MSYAEEWAPGPVVLGGLLLILVAPPFAMIALVILAIAAAAAVVALAGAVLATPYLLVSHIHSRIAERTPAMEGPGLLARFTARVRKATEVAALAPRRTQ
jgi:hypothetical protein